MQSVDGCQETWGDVTDEEVYGLFLFNGATWCNSVVVPRFDSLIDR